MAIDSSNRFLVTSVAAPAGVTAPAGLAIRRLPSSGVLTREEALNLAAWLAVMADPTGEQFAAMRRAVEES